MDINFKKFFHKTVVEICLQSASRAQSKSQNFSYLCYCLPFFLNFSKLLQR